MLLLLGFAALIPTYEFIRILVQTGKWNIRVCHIRHFASIMEGVIDRKRGEALFGRVQRVDAV
ncbi:MAG: hypothetical protein FWH56_04275 [Betaproteobacteria bacterium]|nr:hypothetical protein [Betaproteobacteria bacterium]